MAFGSSRLAQNWRRGGSGIRDRGALGDSIDMIVRFKSSKFVVPLSYTYLEARSICQVLPGPPSKAKRRTTFGPISSYSAFVWQ